MLFRLKFRIINVFLRLGSFLFGYQVPPLPSVSALIFRDDRLLVIDLSYKSGYALPGGVLKGNEDYETAIKREIMEETGLEVTSLEYFGTYCVVDPYSKVNITYKAKVNGKLKASEEGTPQWKDPRRISSKLVYKDNKSAVKELINR